MIFSRMFIWFLIYSLFGWIFEIVYNIIITGKWENRGFLYGPVVPIYGVGAVAITMVYGLIDGLGYKPVAWHVFVISFFGSIILEYSTSWALEKRFHAVWWDYSNLPFNVNGRICLPASTAFGFAGVAVINFVSPWMEDVTSDIPSLAIEGISLAAMALFAADFTLTVSALTEFERIVAKTDEELNRYMENKVEGFYERASGMGQRVSSVGQKVTGMGQAMTGGVGHRMFDREKLFRERMESAFSNIGLPRMGAVRRVRGYRMSAGRSSRLNSETMNKALGFVKIGFYKKFLQRVKAGFRGKKNVETE